MPASVSTPPAAIAEGGEKEAKDSLNKATGDFVLTLLAPGAPRWFSAAILLLIPIGFMVARDAWSWSADHSWSFFVASFDLSFILGLIAKSWAQYGTLVGQRQGNAAPEGNPALVAPHGSATIQVFLPNPDGDPDDEFYQDGLAQRRGFVRAEQFAASIPDRLAVTYQAVEKNERAEQLIERMKRLYEKQDALYFVMTMSSVVTKVRPGFLRWRKQCINDEKPPPVLIATVTSAPDVADASNGIFRWYIRSGEESESLANYLLWRTVVDHVGVFFIEHNDGQQDSPYGLSAMKTFIKHFDGRGKQAIAYSATAATAKYKVRQWVLDLSRQWGTNLRTGAFVVGYGKMLKNVVAEILETGLDVQIACTSTLTGKDWQPDDRARDDRIVTVLPALMDRSAMLSGENQDVVLLFSKLTLLRVLHLTAGGIGRFTERWTSGERAELWTGEQLDQEHLANGDVLVRLTIADSGRWRASP